MRVAFKILHLKIILVQRTTKTISLLQQYILKFYYFMNAKSKHKQNFIDIIAEYGNRMIFNNIINGSNDELFA